jgi:glycosyltransferase involved in cell wall biosynthesis
MNNIKSAIVHDWIPVVGGAEKVLEEIHRAFPSPIYTLMKNDKVIKDSYFKNSTIYTSFIQNLPWAKDKYRNYLPLFPLAIEQFDLSSYDLVISSSYAVAKGVITNSNQVHICYCHSPVRYAWDLHHQYLRDSGLSSGIKGLFAKLILHYIRNWDISSLNRVDHFIANSDYVAKRIKKIYNRDSTVIYPPVDIEKFKLSLNKDSFYLTASRMVPYKRIDLIVEAFSQMPDKRLVVIGDGPDFNKIKAKSGENVELLGFQPSTTLIKYMQNAKAFVFAADEDFGITPVEAQACGTPVIALGKGGALETVIDNKTGVFFKHANVTSIVQAVNYFESTSFDHKLIRENAERFNKTRFEKELKEFIEKAYSSR